MMTPDMDPLFEGMKQTVDEQIKDLDDKISKIQTNKDPTIRERLVEILNRKKDLLKESMDFYKNFYKLMTDIEKSTSELKKLDDEFDSILLG
jgi:hypothetical protein